MPMVYQCSPILHVASAACHLEFLQEGLASANRRLRTSLHQLSARSLFIVDSSVRRENGKCPHRNLCHYIEDQDLTTLAALLVRFRIVAGTFLLCAALTGGRRGSLGRGQVFALCSPGLADLMSICFSQPFQGACPPKRRPIETP